MTYSNGLGNLQQVFGTPSTGATEKTGASSKVEQGGTTSTTQSFIKAVKTDQTNLSSTGALISQAMTGSDVRSEKVAALQQSIAAGTYSVPSSAVADKLIDSMTK